MATLEDIKAGVAVRGLTRQGLAVVRMADWHGDSLEVWFEVDGGGPQSRLLSRADEPQLEVVSGDRPFTFDAPGEDFRIAAEAKRIQLAHLYDPFVAVQTASIQPLPHQIEAVYKDMLPRHPLRFLLADDPGAGKTIMSGLYIRELIIRGDVERCVIVAPGSLVEQWQDELLQRFSLRFDILTRDQVEAAATGNPFTERDRWICRIDQLARNDDLLAKLRAAEWDLGIVDEAHKMSAHYYGNELKKTKRFAVGELLRDRCRHLLLLTATPHSGKEEDFQQFMSLLDPDRFAGKGRKEKTASVDDLMRRYVKENLLTFEGKKLFPERIATTARYELNPLEMALYKAVTHYVTEGMNRAERLQKEKGQRARGLAVGFALTALQRRLASSPEAIFRSLERRVGRLEDKKKAIEEGVEAKDRLPSRLVEGDLEDWDEDDFNDDEFEEMEDAAIEEAFNADDIPEIEHELKELAVLVKLAGEVRASGEDRKWEELKGILDAKEMTRTDGSPRKLIIFTEHKDTLTYLMERIRTYLGIPEAVVAIHGGIKREERRRIQTSFTNEGHVRILVATDAAGEGVNLQRANLMVNYDLPWNPNRIEQRFGRIHRIGQEEVCHLWNLVAVNTREGAVFERLLEKINTIREALGDQVYDVLGDAVLDHSLRDLLIEAIKYGDLPETKAKMTHIIDAEVGARLESVLEERAMASEILDATRIRDIRDEMERAQARKLQPGFIRAFFVSAFSDLGGRIVEREAGRFEITRVPADLRSLDVEASVGGPISSTYERVVFERDLTTVEGKPNADLIAPGHPLLAVVIIDTLARRGTSLRAGTVLIDPDDVGTEPHLVVALEHAISDGTGGSRREVSRRHQFVDIGRDAEITDPGPAPYLDYRPVAPEELVLLSEQVNAAWLGSDAVGVARNYAIAELAQPHLEEVQAITKARVQRVREAVESRLKSEIAHWDQVAAERKSKELAGKRKGGQTSGHARKIADDLEARLERRRRELDRELDLSNQLPVITGGALIIPVGLLGQLEGKKAPARHAKETEEVDRRAVAAVIAVERSIGREPEEMAHHNPGYDIESRDPKTGHLYFIEVKGRIEGADTVDVKVRQIRQAKNHPERFRLAVAIVPEDTTKKPDVHYLVRPFEGYEPHFAQVSLPLNLKTLLAGAVEPC